MSESEVSDQKQTALDLSVVRYIGYTVLVLSGLDYVSVFIPPKFTDAAWELQAATLLIERVVVPLIGMALVFFGAKDQRLKWEQRILSGLSWAALCVGVLYFLLPPLLISVNVRLDQQFNTQVVTQVDQQTELLKRAEQRLAVTNTDAGLNALFLRITGTPAPREFSAKPLPEKRQLLQKQLTKAKPEIRKKIEATFSDRRLTLFRSSIKLLLSSLISGFSFIYIWHLTRWIRPQQPKEDDDLKMLRTEMTDFDL
jgi:hypothetical protein